MDFTNMNTRLEKLGKKFRREFKEYFLDLFKNLKSSDLTSIKKYEDIENLKSSSCFYVILTDYKFKENKCKFVVDGQYKAIYRGHGTNPKKRLASHLFNTEYKQNKGNTNYTVCMKLDGNDGLDINLDDKYINQNWCVYQLPLPNSKLFIRRQAELGFDDAFETPLASLAEKNRNKKTNNHV